MRVLAVIVAVLAAAVYYVEKNLEKFYIFDLTELNDSVQRGIAAHGNDTKAVVESIISDLHGLPHLTDHINLKQEWFFNNAGGAMGGMTILHASVTEYLIIFGTTVGTEGHSGRHTADDYFHIIRGEQWTYEPGEFDPVKYPVGTVNLMKRGVVRQYRMPDTCFALEYARGWIPPMLFFGFADGLTSTLDFPTLYTTTVVTGREMIKNLFLGKL